MRLADLIDRLIEIQNKYDCDDVGVSIMSEHEVDLQTTQFSSKVRDTAVSVGKDDVVGGIIIIGQELD